MINERWEKHTALIFAFICGVLLVVSLCAHFSALFGFNFAHQFPEIWFFLQASVVIGFLPLMIGNPYKKISKPPYIWGSAKYQEPSRFGIYFGLIAAILLCISLLYLVFGEVYWSSQIHFGYLEIKDGNYFLYLKRERQFLPVTFNEYQKLSLYQNLAYSVHWMFLHSLAFMINLSSLEIDLKKSKNE